MSGHSHWSTIKRQKKAEDARRGKLFGKLARAISVAVKEGGGNPDPNTNPRLRLAIEQARLANMSKDSIQRAIQKCNKIGEKGGLEPLVFGGFILSDTALVIEAVTDNRRRTTSQIKNILESRGGTFASLEAIDSFFERVGVITIQREERSEEECLELALEVGAEDITIKGDHVQFKTTPREFSSIKENLNKKGIKVEKDTLKLQPKITSPITEKKDKDLLDQVIKQLEEHEDITKVYTNATFAMA